MPRPAEPPSHRPRRILPRIANAYGLGTVAFLLLREIDGGFLPPITFLTQFSHVVLFLCLPFLVVALHARRRAAVAALGFGAVAFFWFFGSRLVPLAPKSIEARSQTALTIFTLNLGNLRTESEEFVPTLERCGADIVALQEVGEHHAPAIRRELLDTYPHQVIHARGIPGIGLLSKLPIRSHELLELESLHPYLEATIELDGRDVRIINAHPQAWIGLLGRLAREASDLDVLRERATFGGPCILLGDFNTTDQSREYAKFVQAGLIDGWLEAEGGFGFTFPVFGRYRGLPVPPILRLDYIWHTEHFRTLNVQVGEDVGADHLPLRAELAWANRR